MFHCGENYSKLPSSYVVLLSKLFYFSAFFFSNFKMDSVTSILVKDDRSNYSWDLHNGLV